MALTQVTTHGIKDATVATADISNDSITSAKIISNSITSSELANGAVTNTEVASDAAIAGSKISPDFGSQDITTTGHLDLPDNSQLKLGNSQDLKLYHDGSHSVIEATNWTGNLYVKHNSQIFFQNSSGNGYFGIALGYDPANNDYLNTWGSQYSSGANVIGYAVKPSHTTNDVFLSAADNSGFGKGALVIDSEMRYYNAAGSTVAVDSVVSMTERFTVLQNGNVGIGSSTPQQKLDVGNNLRVSNSIYINNMGIIMMV